MSTSSDQPETEPLVADPESSETMAWLLNADKVLTKGMGGTLSEQSNLSGIKRVLDIACGPGGWALEVAREHPEIDVTGIDISESMIRLRKRWSRHGGTIMSDFWSWMRPSRCNLKMHPSTWSMPARSLECWRLVIGQDCSPSASGSYGRAGSFVSPNRKLR